MSTKILLDAIQAVISACYANGTHEDGVIGNAFETLKQEIEMRIEEAANEIGDPRG